MMSGGGQGHHQKIVIQLGIPIRIPHLVSEITWAEDMANLVLF